MSDYKDDDLIYVNPKTKEIKGLVQWTKTGNVKPLPLEEVEEAEEEVKKDDKNIRRRKRKRYHPWGTFKTMKKIYRLEGREKEMEEHRPLEEALQKALKEPFWD